VAAKSAKDSAPAGLLAIVYTPEVNEPSLQTCPGGSISWAFGPINRATTLRINPGLNGPIPRDLWEKAKARPDTQILMGRNILQEIELPPDGAAGPDLEIKALQAPAATRLIYGCRDTSRLQQWLRAEDRQQIRERLAARIKELEEGKL
jgi:hypothetical protein